MKWEGKGDMAEQAQRMGSDFGDRVHWHFSIIASCFVVNNTPCLIAYFTDGRLFWLKELLETTTTRTDVGHMKVYIVAIK